MKNTLIVRTDSDNDFRALFAIVSQIIGTVSAAGQTDGPIHQFAVAGDEDGTDELRQALDNIEKRVIEKARKNGNLAVHDPNAEDEDGVQRELPELFPTMH